MNLDLLCLGLLVFFGLLGLVSGAAQQLAHLGGVVAGWLLSRPIGAAVGPFAARQMGFPTVVGVVGTAVLAFFAVYTITHVVVRFAVKRTIGEHARGAADRIGGFFIGAAKASVIVWLIVSGMVLVHKALGQTGRTFLLDLRGSLVADLARRHNLLGMAGIPGLDALTRLVGAARDPASAKGLQADPAFQALAKDPRIQAIANDERLTRALQEGNVAEVLNSTKVLEMINDPGTLQRLQGFE